MRNCISNQIKHWKTNKDAIFFSSKNLLEIIFVLNVYSTRLRSSSLISSYENIYNNIAFILNHDSLPLVFLDMQHYLLRYQFV